MLSNNSSSLYTHNMSLYHVFIVVLCCSLPISFDPNSSVMALLKALCIDVAVLVYVTTYANTLGVVSVYETMLLYVFILYIYCIHTILYGVLCVHVCVYMYNTV